MEAERGLHSKSPSWNKTCHCFSVRTWFESLFIWNLCWNKTCHLNLKLFWLSVLKNSLMTPPDCTGCYSVTEFLLQPVNKSLSDLVSPSSSSLRSSRFFLVMQHQYMWNKPCSLLLPAHAGWCCPAGEFPVGTRGFRILFQPRLSWWDGTVHIFAASSPQWPVFFCCCWLLPAHQCIKMCMFCGWVLKSGQRPRLV